MTQIVFGDDEQSMYQLRRVLQQCGIPADDIHDDVVDRMRGLVIDEWQHTKPVLEGLVTVDEICECAVCRMKLFGITVEISERRPGWPDPRERAFRMLVQHIQDDLEYEREFRAATAAQPTPASPVP